MDFAKDAGSCGRKAANWHDDRRTWIEATECWFASDPGRAAAIACRVPGTIDLLARHADDFDSAANVVAYIEWGRAEIEAGATSLALFELAHLLTPPSSMGDWSAIFGFSDAVCELGIAMPKSGELLTRHTMCVLQRVCQGRIEPLNGVERLIRVHQHSRASMELRALLEPARVLWSGFHPATFEILPGGAVDVEVARRCAAEWAERLGELQPPLPEHQHP